MGERLLYLPSLGTLPSRAGALRRARAAWRQEAPEARRSRAAVRGVRSLRPAPRHSQRRLARSVHALPGDGEDVPAQREGPLQLGVAEDERGDLAAAMEEYQRAVEIKPDQAQPWRTRTRPPADEAAAGGARRSLQGRPARSGHSDLFGDVGIALHQLGRAKEAEASFRRRSAGGPTPGARSTTSARSSSSRGASRNPTTPSRAPRPSTLRIPTRGPSWDSFSRSSAGTRRRSLPFQRRSASTRARAISSCPSRVRPSRAGGPISRAARWSSARRGGEGAGGSAPEGSMTWRASAGPRGTGGGRGEGKPSGDSGPGGFGREPNLPDTGRWPCVALDSGSWKGLQGVGRRIEAVRANACASSTPCGSLSI